MSTKIKTEDVEGAKIDIHVNDAGVFMAELSGEWVTAKTLDQLLQKARDRVRATRAAIPATQIINPKAWDDDEGKKLPTFFDVEVVGQNTRTGQPLLRAADGKTAMKDYYNAHLVGRLTKADKTEYLRLWTADRDAGNALKTWDKAHRMDVRSELAKAAKESGS